MSNRGLLESARETADRLRRRPLPESTVAGSELAVSFEFFPPKDEKWSVRYGHASKS